MRRRTAARKKGAVMLLVLAAAAAALILLCARIRTGPAADRLVTNGDRLEYLAGLGWEAAETPLSEQTVRIPEEFPPVLAEYNALQLQQGYDLTKYAGKEAQLYIYRILNYPSRTEGEEVCCSLYLYKGRVIGGDIHSTSYTGFMHGLTKP